MLKESWHPTLYSTNAELKQFYLNVMGALYDHPILK